MQEAANATNWVPGLVVLAVAAVLATFFLLTQRRGTLGAKPGAKDNDDLTARYNGLLQELKEHLANQHLQANEPWQKEKLRLERAAAAVLRERDDLRHEQHKAQARAEQKTQAQAGDGGLLTQHQGLKVAVMLVVVVGFFVFLGVQLSSSATERKEGMSVTGKNPREEAGGAMGQQQGEEADPQLEALVARAQREPENVDALADAALALVHNQAFDEARPFVVQATMLDPYQVRARVSRAVLTAVDGDVEASLAELDHLGMTYPEAYDAHLFAGLIALEQNDHLRALRSLETYAKQAPPTEQPQMVADAVSQLRQKLAPQQKLP